MAIARSINNSYFVAVMPNMRLFTPNVTVNKFPIYYISAIVSNTASTEREREALE